MAVIEGLDVELPEYLPIVDSRNGMVAEIDHREGATTAPHLSALLAQVLLAYTLDFERRSELSLPLTANFVRVLGKAGLDVRELPATAGVSREATTMALNFLEKTGYVSVEAKVARLTAKGLEAQAAAPGLHAEVERGWKPRRLRKAHGRESSISARSSPRACARIRTAGGPGRSTSSRRTPSSTTRPAGCRTTRWCSTAAVGRTAV